MKLKNCYYGFTKDGKEHLFLVRYRTVDTSCGSVTYKYYYDIENRKEYDYSEIDMDTLIPYGNKLSNKKYAFRRKVINAYRADGKLEYHVDNLFLGDKYIVTSTTSDYISRYYNKSQKPMNVDLCSENSLFVKLSEDEFVELGSSKIYKPQGDRSLAVGDVCVSNLRNVAHELDIKGVISKRLLLKKHHDKFIKNNKK